MFFENVSKSGADLARGFPAEGAETARIADEHRDLDGADAIWVELDSRRHGSQLEHLVQQASDRAPLPAADVVRDPGHARLQEELVSGHDITHVQEIPDG